VSTGRYLHVDDQSVGLAEGSKFTVEIVGSKRIRLKTEQNHGGGYVHANSDGDTIDTEQRREPRDGMEHDIRENRKGMMWDIEGDVYMPGARVVLKSARKKARFLGAENNAATLKKQSDGNCKWIIEEVEEGCLVSLRKPFLWDSWEQEPSNTLLFWCAWLVFVLDCSEAVGGLWKVVRMHWWNTLIAGLFFKLWAMSLVLAFVENSFHKKGERWVGFFQPIAVSMKLWLYAHRMVGDMLCCLMLLALLMPWFLLDLGLNSAGLSCELHNCLMFGSCEEAKDEEQVDAEVGGIIRRVFRDNPSGGRTIRRALWQLSVLQRNDLQGLTAAQLQRKGVSGEDATRFIAACR